MRIYLLGYMGSGKTTVSRRLATALGLDALDLDVLFEEKFKIEIATFFKKYDESLFRKLESQLLKETLNLDNVVIATGGGTPCFYDNMDWMNKNGLTVYLRVHPLTAASRLSASKKKRPLVINKTQLELLDFVKEHMRQRNIYYSQADLIVKAESLSIPELADLINSAKSFKLKSHMR
jgi:shikimate kinase